MNLNPATIVELANRLNPDELDALKYRLSIAAISEMENTFDCSLDAVKIERFNSVLHCLATIQPFAHRVQDYGIAYIGRPSFISDEVLLSLQDEAVRFRSNARVNGKQFISPVDTPNCCTECEKLEASSELHDFVTSVAGPCLQSYVSNYLYYDTKGQCSEPHVDNAFTAITVMLCLRHDSAESVKSSSSVSYWPDKPRLSYNLNPGELSIFFGTCALHGRTPVRDGEIVNSLLISFRPKLQE